MKYLGVLILLVLSPPSISQIISTVAGNGILGYSGDGGPATNAKLHLPGKVVFDENGNMFIADTWGHRIRKVDAVTGIISTIAGTGIAGYNGDGIQATAAQLNDPVGLAFDSLDNLYIGDAINQRVRKVNLTTGVISTFAGDGIGAGGIGSYSGDGGLATNAGLYSPGYLAVDQHWNLFIADAKNQRIRAVNILTDSITTFAGNGLFGYSGDGLSATLASFDFLEGIAVDPFGNLFICDTNSTIRKVDVSTHIINTVAGIGTSGYSGDGGAATAARLLNPWDIAFDKTGNYYVAEFRGRVRKVDLFGIIQTVAGTTSYGYNGDGRPATSAELNETTGLATDACGNLYIADASNERIRKVTYPPILVTPIISLTGFVTASIGSTVTVNATVSSAGSSYIIHWLNDGLEFTTTTVPLVIYTKGPGTDTITARVVPNSYGCWDSTVSAPHLVMSEVSASPQPSPRERGLWTYPNPARDEVMIFSAGSGEMTIVNTVGRGMLRRQLRDRKETVRMEGWPAGVYVVSVTTSDGGRTVTKFVKE